MGVPSCVTSAQATHSAENDLVKTWYRADNLALAFKYFIDPCSVAVTQNLEIVTELACHVNLTYFPFERNKCKVRFGSYSFSHKRVVFKQTSLSPPFLPNTNLSLTLFPLPAKDRWVKRMVAAGNQHHVYDGFYILVDQSEGAALRYLLPYAGIPLVLVICSVLGFLISGSVRRPAGIDRGPFYSVLLLGGVILYTEAINNVPHGAEKVAPPLIEAVRLSIGAIFVSFLGFFMLVKMIGHLAESNIPRVFKLHRFMQLPFALLKY